MNDIKTDKKTVRLPSSQIIYLECLKDTKRFNSYSGALTHFIEQYLGHEELFVYKDSVGVDSPSNGQRVAFRIEEKLLNRALDSSKKYHNNDFSLFARSAVAYDMELHEYKPNIDILMI